MKKFVVFLIMAAMLVVVAAGCSNNNQNQQSDNVDTPSKTEDDLKIATYAFFVDPLLQLDPANTIYNGVHILNNIYETLLTYEPESGTYKPVLCTSYESSNDGMTWVFYLRQGVKFHTGGEMTAEDVKFSIERVLEHGQGAAYIWDSLDSIEIIDDYTIQFNMTEPCPVDLVMTCCKGTHILSKEYMEANGDDCLVANDADCGTGPYMIHSITWGSETVLQKFDEYWGGWNDNQFDMVVTKYVSETSSRRQMVASGEAYITNTLTAEDLEALSKNDNVTLVREKSIKNMLINISVDRIPDVRVRQALAYAMPYDKIASIALGFDTATPSKCFVPAGILGYTDSLDYYYYDLDKAAQLLEEAGVEKGSLTLLMIYQTGDEGQRKLSELYQTELAKIGINLELRALTWDQEMTMSNSDTANRQDLFLQYCFVDKQSFYDQLRTFHKNDVLNFGRYDGDDFNRLMKEGYVASASDSAKAEQFYIEAQQALMEDCPGFAIVDTNEVWVVNKHMGGFVPNGAYAYICRFYDTYYVE